MDTLIRFLDFPFSALLAISFLVIIAALNFYVRESLFVRILGSLRTARLILGMGVLMLIIEGTWSVPLHRSYFFTLYILTLLLSLGTTIINAFKKKECKATFILSHLGLFIIIWASYFGTPDVSRTKMVVSQGETVNRAYNRNGQLVPVPFDVTLQNFSIDYYPSSKQPRQYTSHLIVNGLPKDVAVNSPCYIQGYTLFQDSYDRRFGRYTVIQIVHDPWLPFIYIGMILLAAGSIMLLLGNWKARLVIPITIGLSLLFTALTVAKINFGTLMPALRSWWFVPHLFIYMVAYSLMALALMIRFVQTIKKDINTLTLSNNLLRSSAALLIIGMLTGSVWARQAWGDYWAWDPKENWAAATWFVALIYLHLQNKGGKKSLAIIILAFLALQMTWYGVNYLPSAKYSLHTYNS